MGVGEESTDLGEGAAPTGSVESLAMPESTESDLLPVPRFQDLRVIGQLLKTYLLCEGAVS